MRRLSPDTDTRPFSARLLSALDRLELQRVNEEPQGNSPWGQGYDNYTEGSPLDSCPYEHDTELRDYTEWIAGWWGAYESDHRR